MRKPERKRVDLAAKNSYSQKHTGKNSKQKCPRILKQLQIIIKQKPVCDIVFKHGKSMNTMFCK